MMRHQEPETDTDTGDLLRPPHSRVRQVAAVREQGPLEHARRRRLERGVPPVPLLAFGRRGDRTLAHEREPDLRLQDGEVASEGCVLPETAHGVRATEAPLL